MKETKLSMVETKIIKEIFGVEKYAVVELIARYDDYGYFSYYEPKIKKIYESKDDAIKYIQANDIYGLFIVPMTQILNTEHLQLWYFDETFIERNAGELKWTSLLIL